MCTYLLSIFNRIIFKLGKLSRYAFGELMNNKIFIISIAILLTIYTLTTTAREDNQMNWNGLIKEKIDLKLPLLIIKGSKGFLACGYINVETCNQTQEACAIVSGVKTHDDMLNAKVKFISDKAEELGIEENMMGSEAIDLIR
jgi:uncharacterized protein YunC (DUF1805 family)